MSVLGAGKGPVEPFDNALLVGHPAKIALTSYFKHDDPVVIVKDADVEKPRDDCGWQK